MFLSFLRDHPFILLVRTPRASMRTSLYRWILISGLGNRSIMFNGVYRSVVMNLPIHSRAWNQERSIHPETLPRSQDRKYIHYQDFKYVSIYEDKKGEIKKEQLKITRRSCNIRTYIPDTHGFRFDIRTALSAQPGHASSIRNFGR